MEDSILSNENETIKGLGAELYDRHETETDDVEFILSVIGEQSKKVLPDPPGFHAKMTEVSFGVGTG